VKFTVTYWLPRQYSAVVESDEVIAALRQYIDAHQHDRARWRLELAAILLADLEAGRWAGALDASALDTIAEALEEVGFTAPDGAEADRTDAPTDYAVEPREA
jgi:hypothetical protein